MKLKDSQNTPTGRSDSPSCEPRRRPSAFREWAFVGSLAALASAPTAAWASFLTGEALDKMADYLAIFVLLVVPIGAIALFWLVHILPEKIAEKRHHPQKDSIKTLCLLSLVFGGMLWPIAWLWAYTKPVAYRMAYGTDKADSYHLELAGKANAGTLSEAEVAHLRDELDAMERRGALPPTLNRLREQLDAMPLPAPKPAERNA